MASVKLGAMVQDVRGSLNGMTFSRNRGGAYVRSKVSPVQPVSDYSACTRAAFTAASERWAATLTQTQRNDWTAFAALHPVINVFGDSVFLSGHAMYVQINARNIALGKTPVDSPVTPWSVYSPVSLTLVAENTADALTKFTFAIGRAMEATELLLCSATPLIDPGRTAQKTQYKLLNVLGAATYTATPVDVFADYNSRYGALSIDVGAVIACKIQVLDFASGAVSEVLTKSVTVVDAA